MGRGSVRRNFVTRWTACPWVPSSRWRSIRRGAACRRGSVQAGLGMYAALKERREDSTCRINGYAVSIASIIPLGAGRVISPDAAIWMMHKSWVDTSGNEDGLRETADALHVHDEMMVDIYSAETGKSKKAVREAMAGAGTWVKGADAVAFGLADEGEEGVNAAVQYFPLAEAFLERCGNIPPAILECIQASAPILISGALCAGQTNNKTTDIMRKALIVALLKRHGIEATETETDEQLQAKLDKIPLAAAAAAAATAAAG